jgi:hypothetical protein
MDTAKVDRILKYLGQQQDAAGAAKDMALHYTYHCAWVIVYRATR